MHKKGYKPYDIALAPAVEFGISRRETDQASSDICERMNEFHILFIHADAGGRNQRRKIANRREAIVSSAIAKCQFDPKLVVFISPVKELEAWALADIDAVFAAFGVTEAPNNALPTSPREAERVADPKAIIIQFAQLVGHRSPNNSGNLVRIAQEQRLFQLRMSPSFREMENHR